MRKIIYEVTPGSRAKRLDAFISSQSNLTRSYIQKLIREGLVLVNSSREKNSHKVQIGDTVEVCIPEQPEHTLLPENIPLNVIWEDEHIIVINKPPDMVVYPAAGNRSHTLMNGLLSRCRLLASAGAPLRPGVVHRLDKDTSGVIVIAKTDTSYYNLAEQFKDRTIEKTYLALLYGSLKKENGEITAPIGRSLSDRKKMSTRTRSGKKAVTRYRVIQAYGSASLAEVRIITGRTHQIRVHFSSIGNPVLGDRVYGKKTSLQSGSKTIKFSRQMLHAQSLKLSHPVHNEPMEFIAPVPEDMEKVMLELGS